MILHGSILATCAVENGGCERVCQDTDRGAKCLCSHGYRLHYDNKTCIGKNTDMQASHIMASILFLVQT